MTGAISVKSVTSSIVLASGIECFLGVREVIPKKLAFNFRTLKTFSVFITRVGDRGVYQVGE